MSKKTFKTAIESGNDAIIQVKENQKKLLKDCQKVIELYHEPSNEYIEKGERERNRIETRNIQIFENPKKYFDQNINQEWGEYIKTIIKVERDRQEWQTKNKGWQTSFEISYYVSSLDLDDNLTAKEYGQAIRNHWGIENKNHYVRDVSLNEDKSRVRVNPDRLVRLRSFSLNILRVNNVKNVKKTLYENALNFNNLFKYKGLLF